VRKYWFLELFDLQAINRAHLTLDSFKPGNYLAMMSHDLHKNHSAVIMSASADHRWLYTSEGNATDAEGHNDCVRYEQRPLWLNGEINPEFDGVGSVSVAF
jgi:hypothetical protein